MSTFVTFDEFHVTVRVPADLEESRGVAIQRILEDQPFQTTLRRAVRQYPDLEPIRIRISR